ncbi:kinase-like domain-containing protein [Rhizophagus irregularis DAOM 181602=DAOM 197198]|nr:kinase-like domain-containing protein [Rhizophagus irregularis DAOM 181602=DAOM 197198]POG62636.1 kinase-like domain-containing protein [Rhizophagus irregularis DAOM 181602=DAOM 197198]|eukprot:XP_025169502.1 kinase-like domain-containing protein [Rhizophagus irregularis DAOM 181602=DAOM 197198]
MSYRHHSVPSIEVKETNTVCKDYDPSTGNKMINKYMLIRELGRGVHGKVKLGKDMETGELFAIKVVDRATRRRLGQRNNDLTNEQKIRKEIAIMKKCIHPHVVRLKEVIDNPASRKIYMVIEYMEGGEIQWKNENDQPVMSIDKARRIFRDVVVGLEYLHHQGIIHRDIKPANLLLTGDQVVKISDFGVSHFSQRTLSSQGKNQINTDDTDLTKTAGSPAFFAPELCFPGDITRDISPASIISENATTSSESKSKSDSSVNLRAQRPPITKAIDIWALGVTLYCFVFGQCPFIADTEFELFFNVIPKQPLEFPNDIPITDDLRDLFTKLLEKDPNKRITLEEVKKHPWVIADLTNPEKWREETDPKKYKAVTVTEEEVKSAYTLKERLKKKIRKISLSLGNLTKGSLRKRSKSISDSPSPIGSPVSSPLSSPLMTRNYPTTTPPSPINIYPPDKNQTLQVAHQRHSLYGSSFPEIYSRQRYKDIENYVEEDSPSLSSSSSRSTIATNSQQWDKAEHNLPRQLAMKRRSNNSHSSLSKSWIYNPNEDSNEVENVVVQDKNIESDSPNNNKLRMDNGKNKHLMVVSGTNQTLPMSSLVPSSSIENGLETTSRENIEILDTMDSDDDDVGVVFGGNASRGWHTSQVQNTLNDSKDSNNSNNSNNSTNL